LFFGIARGGLGVQVLFDNLGWSSSEILLRVVEPTVGANDSRTSHQHDRQDRRCECSRRNTHNALQLVGDISRYEFRLANTGSRGGHPASVDWMAADPVV